jgi:hypothetical protein
MNYRRKNRLLILATAALVVATGAIWAGGFLLNVQVRAGQVDTPQLASGGKPGRVSEPKGDAMAAVFEQLRTLGPRKLRGPLTDVKRPTKVADARVAPKVSLTVSLIGTAREPGHSMAAFRKQDGTLQWVAQGETFETASGEVTLQAVSDVGVTVSLAGTKIKLAIPEEPQRPSTPSRFPFPAGRP